MKQYQHNGLAGCVEQRKRKNGAIVGVYNAEQAGLDDDPETMWYTVCEKHGGCVGHRTLALAMKWGVVPEEWCEECRLTS